ncbi:MAG: PAS domain-containing protein, partial [Kineosporiaceae bacterium]
MPVPDDERLFDLAPAPLVLLTKDLVVVRANRDWLAAARTTPEAAAGRRLTDFLPAELVRSDDPDGIEASLQHVRDTGRPVPVTVRAFDARGGDG